MTVLSLILWGIAVGVLSVVRLGEPTLLRAEALFLLAPLVIVPLALRFSAPSEGGAEPPRPKPGLSPHRLASRAAPFAAVLVGAAFVVERGPVSGLLVLPWLGVTALCASHATQRLFSGLPALPPLPELALLAGLLYLPVGGVWLGVYRLDISLLGFTGTKTLLTATHFHFAGFGACTLAGVLAKAHAERTGHRVLHVGVIATILGIALLAAGISASRPLEIGAAWIVSAGIVTLGAFTAVASLREGDATARVCLAASALSTVVSMAFAVRFSMQGFATLSASTLAEMLDWHGAVNALGFVGAGLYGFSRSRLGQALKQA